MAAATCNSLRICFFVFFLPLSIGSLIRDSVFVLFGKVCVLNFLTAPQFGSAVRGLKDRRAHRPPAPRNVKRLSRSPFSVDVACVLFPLTRRRP